MRHFFHGCAADDILDVCLHGLLARDDRAGVSVTTTEAKARFWMGLKHRCREPHVLRIAAEHLPDLTPENAAPARPDEDFTAGRQILPEHLEIREGGKWVPLLEAYAEILSYSAGD